jgi:hypothetical protein
VYLEKCGSPIYQIGKFLSKMSIAKKIRRKMRRQICEKRKIYERARADERDGGRDEVL